MFPYCYLRKCCFNSPSLNLLCRLIDPGRREKDKEILGYRWPCKLNASSKCGKPFSVSAIKLKSWMFFLIPNIHWHLYLFFCSFLFSSGICSQGFVKLYYLFSQKARRNLKPWKVWLSWFSNFIRFFQVMKYGVS